MKSLTYYLTLLVIKLKGVKQAFSKDPVDFKKLRKADIHSPGSKAFRPHQARQFTVAESVVTEIKPANANKYLVLFCHGGAFVSGPAQHHWDAAKQLVAGTGCTLWMVDYPKAPEHKIDVISENIDAVYATALGQFPAGEIVLIGDSVGGTLVTRLTQRLIDKNVASPAQLILLSPVMDATLSNPEIDEIDQVDPMLSKVGVLSAKRMCAQNGDLKDPRISPINGVFAGFPPTTMVMAGNDITYPDQKIAVQKMKEANVDVRAVFGEGMPPIWPILPVMEEAKSTLDEIISTIKLATQNQFV